MTSAAAAQPEGHVARGIGLRAGQIGVMFLLLGGLAFGGAGRLDWAWAWWWLAIYLASTAVNAAFLLRRDPALVAERAAPGPGVTPRWDAWVSGIWGLAEFIALPLAAGLDVRFGWTGPIDPAWHIAGALVFAAGLGLFGWAMIANAWFSTAVRIQADRGHAVCTVGPYRFVRHPGYAGAVLQSLGGAVLLGSAWALVPAIVATVAIVARTSLEDRMLRSDLPGYREYAADVPQRLVPGLW